MDTGNEPTIQTLSEGQERLTQGQEELTLGQAKLTQGQEELTLGQAKLTQGQEKLTQGQAKLTQGQEELTLGQAKLTRGQEELTLGQAKLTQGQEKLTAGQEKLTLLITGFIEEQRKFNEEQRKFNENVDGRFSIMQDDIEALRNFSQEQRIFNQAQRIFNGNVERRLIAMQDEIAEHSLFITEQRAFNAEQRIFNGNIERRLKTMHDDIAQVKGGHARVETARRAEGIASAINFFYERTLTSGELEDMVRENPVSGVTSNELQSFTKADLIIKAKDSSRLTNYIAVEISYTADQRDIDRAVRNADLLARFTGRPAHPVVASVRNDHVVTKSG